MKALLVSLTITALAPATIAQCVIQGAGEPDATAPTDGWNQTPAPIGFAFPFNGTTYTHFFYSDHGLLCLVNGTTAAAPPGAATYSPGAANLDAFGYPCIFAYWGDHSTQGYGAVPAPPAGLWIDNASGTQCTVTWIDNEPYNSFTAAAFSAQVTLFPSGEIRVRMDSRCNNTSSTFGAVETVVGVHEFGTTIPASSDLSAVTTVATPTVFEEFVGPGGTGNTPDPNFDLADTTLTFIPLSPGWLVTPSMLACDATSAAGTGCGGLSLATTSGVFEGGSWELELSGITAPAPLPNFIAFGAATPPVPVGALFPTLFGATCEGHMDAAFGLVGIGPATGGVAAFSLAVPNAIGLVGASISAQGLAINGATLALSNGETATFGY